MAYDSKYIAHSFRQAVINATYRTGLLASVLTIILIEESDNCNSRASHECNNYFSLEAGKGFQGISRQVEGKSLKAYNDRYACFDDFIAFLKSEDKKKGTGLFRAKKIETQLAKYAELREYEEDWAEHMMAFVGELSDKEGIDFNALDEEAKGLHAEWHKRKAS